ncbi:hypothetical protein DKX38_024928 [Salix brachista]|uniref:Anthocyanidin 3-O-glucosyltransferase n=1 Tax=Salix brachista TaxID=2182728 RepID=A0A5N5JMY2_9ROSI|nr:hypothetical protein DKX38_024928 [Salix brachista]
MGTLRTEPATTLHVVAMPYPGRGHVNPMMNLCKLMSSRKPDILFTFVVTEEWYDFILSDTKKPDSIHFVTIPNCIPSEVGHAKDFPGFLKVVATKMDAPFEQLLDRLELPMDVIIADTYLDWFMFCCFSLDHVSLCFFTAPSFRATRAKWSFSSRAIGYEQVEFTLGVLDLDLALLKDKPDPLTDKSTPEEKTLFNAWERSDRLSIMFLRMTIASNIKTSLPKPENAKDYMKAIEERFKTADKSLAGKLMADLTTIKFDVQDVIIQEIRVHVPLPSISKDGKPPIVEPFNNEEHPMNNPQLHNEIIVNEPIDATPAEPALRRSQRQRRSAISNDYMLYQVESEDGTMKDPFGNNIAAESKSLHLHLVLFFFSERGEERVDYIPGIPPTRLVDFPTVFHGTGRQILPRALEPVSLVSKAQYLLFTSFYGLEAQVISALKPKFPFPVYPIGPSIPYFEIKDHSSVSGNVSGYIEWLNSQPKGSVLYVSMGSFLSVSSSQLDEIVAGVHNSGVSVLVAVFAGVPMLTSPIFWDQIPDSKLIVEDWQIGWRVKRDERSEILVTREEISKLVKSLMDAENIEVKAMRKRAKELQETCRGAIAQGGSSDTNLDSFIRDISQGQSKLGG